MDTLKSELPDALPALKTLSAASLAEGENPCEVLQGFGKSIMDLADTFREDHAIAHRADGNHPREANTQARLLELEVGSLQRRLAASEQSYAGRGQQLIAANTEVETLMENHRSLLREHQNCPSFRRMDELQGQVHGYSTRLDEANSEISRLKKEIESSRLLLRGTPAAREFGYSSRFGLRSPAPLEMQQPPRRRRLFQ
jgi:hypothetical protein